MNEVNILDKLKPSSLGNKDDKIKIEAAVFLTYSIDCKSILGALISMLAETAGEKEETSDQDSEKQKDIVECWKMCLHRGISGEEKTSAIEALKDLQSKVAFVCNDGYDKSISSPIYMYTRELTYYYRWDEVKHSFHPKLYIVRYKKNDDLYFRFLVGSMNLVNSKNKEFLVTLDIRAYKTKPEDGKEYEYCTVINDLLGLDSNYCSKSIKNNKARLGTVIKNLGLDQCWFEKNDINRFVTFPKKDFGGPLQNAQIVISPFLSKSMMDRLGDAKLYTMESELRKLGYVATDKGNVAGKEFFVYSVKEGEKAFNHIKMYINDKNVYAGSANFTGSALGISKETQNQKDIYSIGKNKEVLVRFDVGESFRTTLDEYLKNNYIKKRFVFQEGHKEKQEPFDQFRELAEAIAGCLEQEVKIGDNARRFWHCKLNIVNAKNKVGNAIKPKEAIENWEAWAKQIIDNGKIMIAPFRCKDDVKELNSLSWEIANRMKLDDAFIIYLFADNKPKYSFIYHIDMKDEEETKENNGLNDAMQLTLLRIEALLENKQTNSNTITKDMEEIEKGTLRKDTIGYVRSSLPSLESLLQRNLKSTGKGIDVETIRQRVKRLEAMEVILQNKSLTEEEKKVLGIDGSNIRIINNMMMQGNLLLNELDNSAKGKEYGV